MWHPELDAFVKVFCLSSRLAGARVGTNESSTGSPLRQMQCCHSISAALRLGAALGALACCLLGTPATFADRLHVVIPAAPGGGLDGVARETGRTLLALDLAEHVSFENVSGGGGGRAMAHFLDNASRFEAPLLVNSTPLLVRSLQGLFPYGFRDLTPVAALVADPGVFVVPAGSELASWPALLAALRENPRSLTFGGGSVRGSLDHIVLALALSAAAIEPRSVRYLPYDGGGKAMLALLGGEVDVLSTGLGETVAFLESGRAVALAVSAASRVAASAGTPTLRELGYDVVFANWRGLFAPPDATAEAVERHLKRLNKMKRSEAWQAVLNKRGWASLDADGAQFEDFLAAQEEQLASTLARLGFVQ